MACALFNNVRHDANNLLIMASLNVTRVAAMLPSRHDNVSALGVIDTAATVVVALIRDVVVSIIRLIVYRRKR